jgi:hypothetical protein
MDPSPRLKYSTCFLYPILKHDEVRFESERENSSGSEFTAGLINGRDRITKHQRLHLSIDLHGVRIGGEGAWEL